MFQQGKPIAAAIAMAILICSSSLSLATGANPANPRWETKNTPLELTAQRKFGPALTAAERKLLRAASTRALAWLGPNDDPDSPANDTAQAEHWGPERIV